MPSLYREAKLFSDNATNKQLTFCFHRSHLWTHTLSMSLYVDATKVVHLGGTKDENMKYNRPVVCVRFSLPAPHEVSKILACILFFILVLLSCSESTV